MKKYIQVIETTPNIVVKTLDVTGKSERQVQSIYSGMLINLNHESYHLEYVEKDN